MRTSELGDPSLNSADLDASLLRPREKAQVSAPGRRTAEQRRKRRRLLPRLGPPGPRLSTVDSRPFCSKTWHSAALRCGAVLFATFTRKQGLDEAWGARVRTDGDLPGSPNRPRMTRKLERSEHHHIIKGAPALAPSPRPMAVAVAGARAFKSESPGAALAKSGKPRPARQRCRPQSTEHRPALLKALLCFFASPRMGNF